MAIPIKNTRAWITIAIVLFGLVGLAAMLLNGLAGSGWQDIRSQAAGTTTMSIMPSKLTVEPGKTFSVTVQIDTHADTVAAVDLTVGFDGTKLTPISIENGDFLPVVLASGEVSANTAHIIVGAEPAKLKTGIGTVAILTFQAGPAIKRATPISIDAATEVASIGFTTSSLTRVRSANISIKPCTRNCTP